MDPRIPMPGDPNYDPGAFQTPAPWPTPPPPDPRVQAGGPGGFFVETSGGGFNAQPGAYTPVDTNLAPTGPTQPTPPPLPPYSPPSFTPPAPPDITGYRPQTPSMGGPNIPSLPNTSTRPSGGDRGFNFLRSLDNFQPDFPAWVRGLQRSPYAQYAQHNAAPFAAPPRGMLRYEEDPYTPTPPPPWAVLGA